MSEKYKGKPMTYKQIVHKIIYDAGYAREIHELILKARRKDKSAIHDLESRFRLGPEELEDIGLSKGELDRLSCDKGDSEIFSTNHTSWMLLDFAAMLP